MSVLLQLSDSHFGTEQAPVVEVVEALAALAQQQQPDLLVLSGDITQRAKRSQFAAARAFIDHAGTGTRAARCLRPRSRAWRAGCAPARPSQLRAGAANSVNVLRWGGDTAPRCCIIEQWDYTTATPAFVRTGVTEIHLARTSK